MSAIWGAVCYNGNSLPQGLGQRMKQPYEKCVIDDFREYLGEDAVLGCGVQYVTREAHKEVLPIVDSESQTMFTADIMLDNRDALLSKLGMDNNTEIIPDGTIAYEMFKRYGEDCLNELLGAYAFVYYDKKQRKVNMVLDAVGNRCLYYRIKAGVLYFSSLIEPLLATEEIEEINERWITDFLSLDSLALRMEYEETPYAGIYRVAPRQIVSFDGESLHKRKYWDPEPKELKLQSDEEYSSRLKEIYQSSIKCLFRNEKISLLLSGGLDSTSVACYAARELKKRGETLYTYTSVPEPQYVSNKPARLLTDESERVLKTKTYLENEGCRLECNFLDLVGINGWDGRNAEMEALEFPYKSIQNLLWMSEAMRAAYTSGSRILLDGGYGNVSISSSGIGFYLNELLHKKRFITFFRQFHRFSRSHEHSGKKEIKEMLKTIQEYIVKPKTDLSDEALFINSFVSKEMIEKYQARKRFGENAEEMAMRERSFKAYRKLLIHDLIFSQKGETSTKHSLITGTITRDPTMDKRLIEFCAGLPADQCVRDGISRRLVRVYMADDMPAHVMSPKQHGMQSADTIERILPHWERIYSEILKIYKDNIGSPYVDCDRAIKELEGMKDHLKTTKTFDLVRICYTAMTLEFIRKIQSGKSTI